MCALVLAPCAKRVRKYRFAWARAQSERSMHLSIRFHLYHMPMVISHPKREPRRLLPTSLYSIFCSPLSTLRFTSSDSFATSVQALHALSGCRMSLLSPRLTFHFVEGDSVVKHPGNQCAALVVSILNAVKSHVRGRPPTAKVCHSRLHEQSNL